MIPSPATLSGRDLFVYGTLMDAKIQAELLGRRLRCSRAMLFGFRRTALPCCYPYVQRDRTARVEGLLLRNLSSAELAVLDAYEEEGILYSRQRVTVRVGEVTYHAWTYVGIVEALHGIRSRRFDDNRAMLAGKVMGAPVTG